MASLICELCNSTDFVKEGDYFVCQSCGMKYTADEARARFSEEESQPEPSSNEKAVPDEEPKQVAPAQEAQVKPFDMQCVAQNYSAALKDIDEGLPEAAQIEARTAAVNAAIDDSIEPYGDFVMNNWTEWRNTLENLSKTDRQGYANFSLGFENDHKTMKALTSLVETLNDILVDHINFVMPKAGQVRLDSANMGYFDSIVKGYEALARQINLTPFYRSDTNGVHLWKNICKPNVTYFEKTFKAWTDERLEIYFANHTGAREEYAALEKTLAQEEDKVNKNKKKARFFQRKDREKAATSEELDAAKAVEEAFRRHAIAEVLAMEQKA